MLEQDCVFNLDVAKWFGITSTGAAKHKSNYKMRIIAKWHWPPCNSPFSTPFVDNKEPNFNAFHIFGQFIDLILPVIIKYIRRICKLARKIREDSQWRGSVRFRYCWHHLADNNCLNKNLADYIRLPVLEHDLSIIYFSHHLYVHMKSRDINCNFGTDCIFNKVVQVIDLN